MHVLACVRTDLAEQIGSERNCVVVAELALHGLEKLLRGVLMYLRECEIKKE